MPRRESTAARVSRQARQVCPEKAAGVRRFACGNLLWRTSDHDLASTVTALWAKIDHIVRGLDDIEVMLDEKYRVPGVDEAV